MVAELVRAAPPSSWAPDWSLWAGSNPAAYKPTRPVTVGGTEQEEETLHLHPGGTTLAAGTTGRGNPMTGPVDPTGVPEPVTRTRNRVTTVANAVWKNKPNALPKETPSH